MRIRLSDTRRERVLHALRSLFRDEFDEDLSEFRAERILERMVSELGPVLYNQAVQDTRGYMLEKISGELYEPEPREPGP